MENDPDGAILGCLLGTAVGDALGLPCEGLPRRRQRLLFPDLDGYHFLFGRGMVSDDTEHTCLVAQALIVSAGEVDLFGRRLARDLRFWLLGLPAGIGYATLKAICRLWLGFGPARSGVFSAGNGPAMRAAILGVCHGDDLDHLRALVRASTRLTHTDPKAEHGALAVALAAHHVGSTPREYHALLARALGEAGGELADLVARAVESARGGATTEAFAESLGLGRGVGGYVYHTVPVVLHAWFRHPADLRAALLEVIRCGGDTDTTAAILGGIVGARVGRAGIPAPWLAGLCEWPRSPAWIEALARRLAGVVRTGRAQPAAPLPALGLALRNLVFLAVVLLHGLRRLLPPY
jgi:ADP-ribosyl-[dinitrogen reductase] hydrolase